MLWLSVDALTAGGRDEGKGMLSSWRSEDPQDVVGARVPRLGEGAAGAGGCAALQLQLPTASSQRSVRGLAHFRALALGRAAGEEWVATGGGLVFHGRVMIRKPTRRRRAMVWENPRIVWVTLLAFCLQILVAAVPCHEDAPGWGGPERRIQSSGESHGGGDHDHDAATCEFCQASAATSHLILEDDSAGTILPSRQWVGVDDLPRIDLLSFTVSGHPTRAPPGKRI